MAAATGRRPKSISVSKQAVDQAGILLQQLPEKPKEALSLRDAIDQLQEEIRDALSKGYTYADLVGLLANRGIQISPATLKRYVSMGRSKTKKTRKTAAKTGVKRPRKTQGDASDSAEDSSDDSFPDEDEPSLRKRRASASTDAEPDDDQGPTQTTRRRSRSTAAKPTAQTSSRGRRRSSDA